MRRKSSKIFVPQNPGEIPFDFVTLLASVLGADAGTQCSIMHFGLAADLGCSAAFCDMVGRQRLVVVVGGIGGSEEPSWKHQTCLPFVRFAPPGTTGAWLVKFAPEAETRLGDPS